MADGSDLKIKERSNVEGLNLWVTKIWNNNLKNWFILRGKFEHWKNCE